MRSNLLLLDKIKVGAVSYINTKPLIYGIKQHAVFKNIELTEDYPANVAQNLLNGTIDLGLVPVATILKMKEWHLVTDYCIGSEGAVASVCLFSDVPVWEIEKVYLDYQSRTSVRLAQVLLNEYWNANVSYIDASGDDFRSKIKGRAAGVVIGDRALEQRLISPYIYDLGEAWKQHTGLPFVFAGWISNKELPQAFLKKFNDANAFGVSNSDAVAEQLSYSAFDLKRYFKSCISYHLTDAKRTGLSLFLDKLQNLT